MSQAKQRVVITGAAGLVGQNLVTLLQPRPDLELVGIDRHVHNLDILRRRHPDIEVVHADLAEPGTWEAVFEDAAVVVQLHAQVTGGSREPFERNNVLATQRVLACMRAYGVKYLVHVSTSAVHSAAEDHYKATKVLQERIVRDSGVDHCVLRPTLMYGWFDPKHLGWIASLMERVPVVPIPGHGRYLRQPLYVRDFCRVLEVCLQPRE
jgi:nucleoside-diphosphate-sugar epimerase